MRYLFLSLLFFGASLAYGQMSYDPVSTTPAHQYRVGGGLTLSKIEYEADDADFEAERTVLGASAAGSATPGVDIFGLLGLILDGELDFDPGGDVDDGSGFMFAGGARGLVYRQPRMNVSAFGLFSYLTEKYDDDVEVDIDVMELSGGSAVEYEVNEMLRPYVGIALVLLSNGDIDVEGADSEDMERDKIFNIHLGANVELGAAILRPEIILFGEQTLGFSAVAFL